MIAVLIAIPEWGHATILEIAWTMIGLLTLIIVTWNFGGARSNLHTPVDLSDDYELEAATRIRKGYVRREAVRFVIAFLILVTGITGDLVASVSKPSVTTITGLVLTAAFFLIGLMTAVQSFFDQRDREKIRDLLVKSRRLRRTADWESTRHHAGLDDV